MNRVVIYNEFGQPLYVLAFASVQCTTTLNEVGTATIETEELPLEAVDTICSSAANFVRIFYVRKGFFNEYKVLVWSGFLTGATVRRENSRTMTTLTAISAEDFLRRRYVLYRKEETPDNQYRWYADGTALGTIINGLLRNYQSDGQRFVSNPFPFTIIQDVQTVVTVPEIDTGERTPYEVLRTIIRRYGTYFKAVIEGTNSIRLIVRTLFSFPTPVALITPSEPFLSEFREEWRAADDGALIVWYGGSSEPYQAASSFYNSARERIYRANTSIQGEATFEAVSSLDPYPTKIRVMSFSMKEPLHPDLLVTGNAVVVKNEFLYGNRALIKSVTYRSQNGTDEATVELTNVL